MTEGETISKMRRPIMIREVLLILVTMALFLFALESRDHAHGGRRREADSALDVQAAPVANHWQRYEAEALEDAVVRPAFGASL